MINIAWFLFSVGDAIAFVVGASLFFRGALTIGTVYLIFHYTNLISQPLERIAQEFEQFQRAGAGIARIQELFETESRLAEAPATAAGAVSPAGGDRAEPTGALAVEFERVRFAFPTDAPTEERTSEDERFALDSFQLRLAPNEVLGLLGRRAAARQRWRVYCCVCTTWTAAVCWWRGAGCAPVASAPTTDAGGNGHPKRTAVSGVDSGLPDLL